MSLRYEVVLSCFLREETPETVLATLRRHLGLDESPPAAPDDAYPLLEPDPDSRLPGGDAATLRFQPEAHAWGLFSRNQWLDDDLGELATVLDLIAPHVAEPGYGGYVREDGDARGTAITFRDGTYGLLGHEPGGSAA
ncbi:hypothetical protein GCM10010218_22820 [Streptomyces mashuensis]|uniref:Uncharacterized protein n=1 Tax=Streptomyces mashuensis TaxID=33904 RepID=A0A919B3G1_9ACTN|nr:hypothetical protein [Streptomyces mashuensis]GHF40842.1 hypothetical protein GCM10010218_22820 [Streptomyces mashuensis]